MLANCATANRVGAFMMIYRVVGTGLEMRKRPWTKRSKSACAATSRKKFAQKATLRRTKRSAGETASHESESTNSSDAFSSVTPTVLYVTFRHDSTPSKHLSTNFSWIFVEQHAPRVGFLTELDDLSNVVGYPAASFEYAG